MNKKNSSNNNETRFCRHYEISKDILEDYEGTVEVIWASYGNCGSDMGVIWELWE